jgi:succinate-semialdehyde dehydrogenase/glutarate-semialdehyde dehydrogenase
MSSGVMQPEQALGALPPLKLFIGGKWVDSDSKEQIDVVSPSSGKLLAKIPHASAADVGRAVSCARGAWEGWRMTAPFERAAACHRIADRILARKEQIAAIISLEQGKPYHAEALPEVEETAENFRIAAEDWKRRLSRPGTRISGCSHLRWRLERGASSRRGISRQ